MTRAIVFPGGGGGNHLRWLLYLDQSIDSEKSIDEKMDFVLNKIYADMRSFYNWLPYESQWRYDDHYESFIKILHEPKDDKPEYKSVFLTYEDWNIPFNHYTCLTSGFSSERSYNMYYDFIRTFDNRIKRYIELTENKLVIKSDSFFDEQLDKTFYSKIVDFFEFKSYYNEAAILHKKWYEARQRVRKECYDFYNGQFWQSFMLKMRGDVQRNKGLLP